MKTTRYFSEQVLTRRAYLSIELCESALARTVNSEQQGDGRIRIWSEVVLPGEQQSRIAANPARRWRDVAQRLPRSRLRQGYEMKLHYYPETDSLYIELKDARGVETREISEGLNADLDADGTIVGFDIDQASMKLDLSTLETHALPFSAAA